MNKGNQNDEAWEKLFEKYDVLEKINIEGRFEISASQMKEFREPRLMAKFDHTVNLPKLFIDNKLAILPITRGDYVISHFEAYQKFEDNNVPITRLSLPSYIQSLDCNNISSETIALNCALVSGIAADFLEDEDLVPTVSGRMGSGTFNFSINSSVGKYPYNITVNNSQIEIDAAYEGINSLALFEAKRDLSEDFLVRQLYYPYRVWQSRITKPVRPLFLVYSNGIYRLYEYAFADYDSYNSIYLVKQKNYSIEDTKISVTDIEDVLHKTVVISEPEISFPQADSFERVINLCELLNEQDLKKNEVTEEYAFDERQTDYYVTAAHYLDLVDRCSENNEIIFNLTKKGKRILNLGFKQRQLKLCSVILSHKPFNETLKKYFTTGTMPSKDEIVKYMKESSLYNVKSEETYKRRASTVRHWVNWIIGLINDD